MIKIWESIQLNPLNFISCFESIFNIIENPTLIHILVEYDIRENMNR